MHCLLTTVLSNQLQEGAGKLSQQSNTLDRVTLLYGTHTSLNRNVIKDYHKKTDLRTNGFAVKKMDHLILAHL